MLTKGSDLVTASHFLTQPITMITISVVTYAVPNRKNTTVRANIAVCM